MTQVDCAVAFSVFYPELPHLERVRPSAPPCSNHKTQGGAEEQAEPQRSSSQAHQEVACFASIIKRDGGKLKQTLRVMTKYRVLVWTAGL